MDDLEVLIKLFKKLFKKFYRPGGRFYLDKFFKKFLRPARGALRGTGARGAERSDVRRGGARRSGVTFTFYPKGLRGGTQAGGGPTAEKNRPRRAPLRGNCCQKVRRGAALAPPLQQMNPRTSRAPRTVL